MTTIFGNTITEPKVAFSFEKDQLTLYSAPEHVSLPDDSIIGVAINTSKKYYFRLLSDTCKYISSIPIIGNIHIKTIYYVEDYQDCQMYEAIILSFPVLDFFLADVLLKKNNPSVSEENKCHIWTYHSTFKGRAISLIFSTQRDSVDSTNFKYTWRAQLKICSEQPFEPDFAYEVVRYVQGLFSFIYNRADIVVGNVVLSGTKTYFRPKNPEFRTNNLEEHSCPIQSSLKFTESFSDNTPDFLNYLPNNHIGLALFETKFDRLIHMLFDDKILFYPLMKAEKGIYNLGRILYLNYHFEHYFKLIESLYPSAKVIVVYNKKKLANKNDNKKVSELRLALRLIYVFDPNLMTERNYKNAKVIRLGSFKWDGVCGILNDYYPADCIYDIVEHYTRWRNAEAHVNDLPLDDPQAFIESVRFVESMNYCVVLKIAGYSNEEIHLIIDRLLFAQNHGVSLPTAQ